LLGYLAAQLIDLPARVFNFTTAGIDEALFAGAILGVALLVYIERRRRDLAREIAARRVAEHEFRRLARHDPVTGLPNRRLFTEKLDEALRQAATYQDPVAVLMLGLDGMTAINDARGHGFGDAVLIEFATRMTALLPRGTVMARLGGDEFAIVLSNIEPDDPARLAIRILGTLAKPFRVAEVSVTLSAGIGIAVAPDNGSDREVLMRRADMALSRSKADGHSLARFFAPEMDKLATRRALIERELRDETGPPVAVHYLQLVSLDRGQIIGFEALARWIGSSLGPVLPQEFIAVAEECGLIAELGDRLLRVACRDALRWPPNLTLSFNLSPVQLRDPGIGSRILAILAEVGLDPRRLELEVAEGTLLTFDAAVESAIAGLRAAGVKIALDDFGMGYATMSQLLRLRFDKLKIDRGFIENLGKDPRSDAIVRATIGLAQGLSLIHI